LKDRRRMKVASCRPKSVHGKDNEPTQVYLSVKNKITKPVSKFLLFWEMGRKYAWQGADVAHP
jgi:hypothetical protein